VVCELLDQVPVDGAEMVRLPAMTAAELCLLGAMTSTLIDAAAWTWWDSAPVSRRRELRAAWRFLAWRRLISPGPCMRGDPGDAGQVRVAPAAALIVAARTRPAFVLLCRAGDDGEPERTRMYGLADARHGLRAVLIEQAGIEPVGWAGPAYGYQLASPGGAAGALARWALGPASEPAGDGQARLVDVHLPGTRDARPAQQIRVQADNGRFRVIAEPHWLSVTNQLPCDEVVLTRLLTDTLTGACP
jgi:hypothetical protein